MPGPLKNARRERFAQEVANGKTLIEAHGVAGYNPDRGAATRLAAKPEVAARLAELKARTAEKLAEKTAIDAAWVLDKAAKLHDEAMGAKSYSAAKGALDLIGKHVDVQAFREQIQHSGLIEYKNLSDEEITARIAAHEAERASRPTTH